MMIGRKSFLETNLIQGPGRFLPFMTFMMVQFQKMLFLKGAIARRLSTHWMATKNHDDFWRIPAPKNYQTKNSGGNR